MKERTYHEAVGGGSRKRSQDNVGDESSPSTGVSGNPLALQRRRERPGYEATGRTGQKARTRALLVEQARRLMARGPTPSVADVAAAAGISRTTAYRYFPNRIDLVRAAHPEIEARTLLPDPAPADVPARLDAVLDGHFRLLLEWEPQLRAALRVSLEGAEQPVLRGGRAVRWIREALIPLHRTHPDVDIDRLAVQLRAAAGIEPYVWLVDVARVSPQEALHVMRATARCLLRDAMAGRVTGHERDEWPQA